MLEYVKPINKASYKHFSYNHGDFLLDSAKTSLGKIIKKIPLCRKPPDEHTGVDTYFSSQCQAIKLMVLCQQTTKRQKS